MFTYNRPSLDLNGSWKFCPDPMQRCRRQQWWKNPPVVTEFKPCWDPEGLWDIQVPGTWKKQFDALEWYDGHAVYFKEFDTEKCGLDREAFLVFDGVIYESEIYLNGQYLSRHEWGYSAFSIRVTDVLQEHNQLFVLVDNLLKKDRVPGEIFDWNNDGGIINGVKLVYVPRVYIENFKCTTRIDGEFANIAVEVMLESRDRRACEKVKVSIPELGLRGEVYAEVGEVARVELSCPLDKIRLWNPADPKLYDIEFQTGRETLKDEIGIREISRDGYNIMLNGVPVRLYGVNVHSEFPETGRTATDGSIQKLIATVKDLGVNFLRCAHYPYAEIWGRAMDRAGLLWLEEVPAYWLPNMGDPRMIRKACGMMSETIRRDWNRASIIMWSISNECCWKNPDDDSENNYPYWRTVVPLVKGLDSSRLITAAESGMMIAPHPVWNPGCADDFDRKVDEAGLWRPGHNDEIYDLFDVLSANIYVQKTGEAAVTYGRFVDMFKPYKKPMMLSEFGGASLMGATAESTGLGKTAYGVEERHEMLIIEAYDAFRRLPELSGYSPWILTDGRAPIHWRWYNQGKAVYRYGFLDEDWRKKKIFDVLKNAIAGLKKHFEALT